MDRHDLFKPEPNEYHHLMFSSLVFSWVLLSASMSTSKPPSSPRNSFHFIYPFDISVMFFVFPFFTPKLFSNFCIRSLVCSPQLLRRIFFRYFRRSCFACIAGHCLCIFWVSFLSLIFSDLFFQFYYQTCLLFCLGLFILLYLCVLFLPWYVCLLSQFSLLVLQA